VSVIDVGRLSLNQATVQTLSAIEAIDVCVRHDIAAIGLWRDKVEQSGLAVTAAAARAAGVHVSSLCRGGFFTHADADRRAAAAADNRAAVREAAALGADVLILVAGGLIPGSKDLPLARRMIADAVADLIPVAQQCGVRLGIEALHPMFCADRCAISRLGDAVDLAAQFPAESVGVVVDTYHVWWDASLAVDVGNAAGRIASYQLCDWILPLPPDVLLGRGHLGDGYIDLAAITKTVLAAGYDGFAEVEIFNQEIWDAPADDTVATVKARFAALARELA
jgi:sugar phosphate isomerase/epimerase